MGRLLFFITLMTSFILASAPAEAKIYIWTDQDNKTHYCNDPDDVPAEYKEKVRTIESAASSTQPAERTATEPQKTSPSPASPISPQAIKGGPGSPGMGEELDDLMQAYRAMRDELKEYRRSGKDLKSPDYNELKMQLVEIKKKINQAQIKNRNKAK